MVVKGRVERTVGVKADQLSDRHAVISIKSTERQDLSVRQCLNLIHKLPGKGICLDLRIKGRIDPIQNAVPGIGRVAENDDHEKQENYPYIYDIEGGNSLQNIRFAVVCRFDNFHLFLASLLVNLLLFPTPAGSVAQRRFVVV